MISPKAFFPLIRLIVISQPNSNNARQKAGGSECVCKVNSEILIMNLERAKRKGCLCFGIQTRQTHTEGVCNQSGNLETNTSGRITLCHKAEWNITCHCAGT